MYNEKIAKKYHPDTIKEEEQTIIAKDKFKEITEAYSIIGDVEKRGKYDKVLYGDASRGDFSNQEAYDYWKDKKPSGGDKKYKSPEEQR